MRTQQDQRTIVVGVDGSPASRAALRWAMELASAQDFQVAAVAVQRRTPAFMPASSMALLPYGRAPETSPAVRAERLHAIVEQTGGEAAEYVMTGDPARELTRMARPGDLIVLGSTGTATTMLGSVTMACIRNARCPVVAVPAEHEESAR